MAASDDQTTQDQNLDLREALNDAYAFVEGQKVTQSFAAITFEELLDQQIERLVGASTDAKPNAFDLITRIKNNVVQAVAKIKSMPPSAFVTNDPMTNVNTPK